MYLNGKLQPKDRDRGRVNANGFIGALLLILFVCGSFGCTALLRNHGIDSCRERGGTPITSSWLSKDAWDVRCIHKPQGS